MMVMIMNAVQMCQLVKRLLRIFIFADFLNAFISKVTEVVYIWYQSEVTTLELLGLLQICNLAISVRYFIEFVG